MKRFLSLATGTLVIMSGALAGGFVGTAAADDTRRAANCAAIGGTFVNGSSDGQDRCDVVTGGTPQTILGETTTSVDLLQPVGEVYAGEVTFDLLLDQAVTTSETVFGTWTVVSVVNGAAIPGTCTRVDKGKGTVSKCQYNQVTTEQRTNTVTTTTTTPVVQITQQLQDTQTVTTDTTPTTIRTVTTTASYKFRGGGTGEAADQISNGQPASGTSTTEVPGEDVVVVVETPDAEQQVLEPIVEEAPSQVDVVVTNPTQTQETIVVAPCKSNKGSDKRTNACPTAP